MNEKSLIEQVLRLINRNYSNIYVIDILGDHVFGFEFSHDNKLVISKTTTYTDFIENARNFIYADDLNSYFSAISLNNLEIESQKGNQETKVKYRKLESTGNYRYNVNIINYLPFENKKLIFMMSEDVDDRLTDTEEQVANLTQKNIEYENRLNEESESIGNAILEINNILDMNDSNNASTTRNYINSVFNKVSSDHPDLNKAIQSKMIDSVNYVKPSILIVDDSSIIRNSLKRIFANDYDIIFAKNGNEAIEIITKNILNKNQDSKNIGGILLDLIMPECDGFVVLDFMKNFNLLKKIPVAIISGDETKETRRRVYQYDIVDMLEKPFNTENIRRRIGKIISMYMTSSNMQTIINNQTKELNNNSEAKDLSGLQVVVNRMVENILNNDDSIRIKKMARIIATSLANTSSNYNLTPKYIEYIMEYAPLYNIGAMAIPSNEIVSSKSIKQEIDYGLAIVDSYINNKEELNIASNIIKYSFEMFNGSGYPNNLVGNEIPIEAQISNIVVRLVKSNKSFAATMKAITETEAEKYNPDLVEILKIVKKEIKDV